VEDRIKGFGAAASWATPRLETVTLGLRLDHDIRVMTSN
jgi:hypothetical protein